MGGIDAMALSASDWALGAEFVRGLITKHDLPIVAANLVCDGDAPFPPSRTLTVNGRRIGVVGVTVGPVPGCEVADPLPAVAKAAAALENVDLTVALLPIVQARDVAQAFTTLDKKLDVDLVVDATNRSLSAQPQQRAGAWSISAGSRGRHLGVATLVFGQGPWSFELGAGNKLEEQLARFKERKAEVERLAADADDAAKSRYQSQITAYERRIGEVQDQLKAGSNSTNRIALTSVPLDRTVADHPATLKIVEAGKEAITTLGGASPKTFVTRKVKSGPYAGGEVCAGCHPGPHAQWSRTGHARAWQALVNDNRAFDDACWSCHVTGARKPGGPQTVKETGPFRDVQCEACHGPGRAHVENPAEVKPVRDPGPAVCTECHDGVRDGGQFVYEDYRPKVVHEDVAK